MMNKIENTAGEILYGMHFYPGVAEYQDAESDQAYRVYLNEDTIRAMDPTFAGKPVFLEHVDGVEPSLDELKKEADGWVVESFFNSADGKHWVKFIVVSERAKHAVKNGYRLSNSYFPKSFLDGGLWNGVSYQKQITDGEYEHLALVQNPRYEESVILTPEEFKQYNEDKQITLKKLANSKKKTGEKTTMGLNIFKRAKVENTIDLENTFVELPKSKKELTIATLVNEMDKVLNMQGYASEDHMVKVGNEEMSVKDLVKKHMDACNSLEEMKKANEAKPEDEDEKKNEAGKEDEDEKKNAEDEMKKAEDEKKNAEDSSAKKEEEEKNKNELIRQKNTALKNAHLKSQSAPRQTLDLMPDKLARGRDLF